MKTNLSPIVRVYSRSGYYFNRGYLTKYGQSRLRLNWFAVAFWACVGFTAGLGYVILAWCFAS